MFLAILNMEEMAENEFSSTIAILMNNVRMNLSAITARHGCPTFNNGDVITKQVLKQWCVNFKDVIAHQEVIPDPKNAKIARTCVDFIELYIDVLDFFLKCRSSDALDHLQKWLQQTELAKLEKYDKQEKMIYESAKNALAKLRELDQSGKFVNPNLEIMKDLLSEKFLADSESKGMLMVEMRKYAHVLKYCIPHLYRNIEKKDVDATRCIWQKWLEDTDSLNTFNISAQVFTGTGNSSADENDSLTHLQQKKIMDDFREGKHKLLICTPDSAGEGIDVTDCNFVIIYDIMTNEVTVTQIKGRARKKEGEIFQLCSERVARRDCLNKRKTKLMETARRKIEQEIEENLQQYQSELRCLQKEEFLIERIKKTKPVAAKSNDEFIFKCKLCSVQVCSSLDIRVVDSTQHICINPDFEKKYKSELLKKKRKNWDDWAQKNSVLCDNCGEEWGKECEWKGIVTVALLTIKGFVLFSKSNSPKKILTPKKWKDVPFDVSELKTEEMEALLNA